MEFVNALGCLVLLFGVIAIGGYALRHRGRIIKWIENMDHAGNVKEKQARALELKRKREDITKEIEELEQETETETGED